MKLILNEGISIKSDLKRFFRGHDLNVGAVIDERISKVKTKKEKDQLELDLNNAIKGLEDEVISGDDTLSVNLKKAFKLAFKGVIRGPFFEKVVTMAHENGSLDKTISIIKKKLSKVRRLKV